MKEQGCIASLVIFENPLVPMGNWTLGAVFRITTHTKRPNLSSIP